MARTLKARSGSTFTEDFPYVDDEGTAIDTEGSTARLQLRAAHAPERILLQAQESDVEGSFLFRDDNGWVVTLPSSFTKLLPPTTRFEIELVDNSEEATTTTVEVGVIRTEPEVVKTS